jgi:hypothetical protein
MSKIAERQDKKNTESVKTVAWQGTPANEYGSTAATCYDRRPLPYRLSRYGIHFKSLRLGHQIHKLGLVELMQGVMNHRPPA